MGKILDILALPYKERVDALNEIDTSVEPIGIFSPIDFKVRFKGRFHEIKSGFKKYAPGFALFILDKFGPHSSYGKTFSSDKDGNPLQNPVLLDYDPAPKQKQKPEPGTNPKDAE